jgi:FkbM family methyltransferase
MNKAVRAFKAFLGITNPRTWGPFVYAFENSKFDYPFHISWSQGGEDIGLAMVFRGIKNGKYVDVGAHHPSRFSVTRKLQSTGWSGINIDANPDLIAEFDRKRPNDINLWNCIGSQKEYEFTIFEDPAISTVNEEWRTKFLGLDKKIKSEIKVPGRPLHDVFTQYFKGGYPDLLCIDAEGADLDVLQSAQLTYGVGPEWLLLEADPPLSNITKTPAVKFALELGYEVHLILGMSTLLHKKP